MAAARDIMAAMAVHVGERYVGEVIEWRCGQWQAATATGKVIGTFTDQRAASDGVLFPHG